MHTNEPYPQMAGFNSYMGAIKTKGLKPEWIASGIKQFLPLHGEGYWGWRQRVDKAGRLAVKQIIGLPKIEKMTPPDLYMFLYQRAYLTLKLPPPYAKFTPIEPIPVSVTLPATTAVPPQMPQPPPAAPLPMPPPPSELQPAPALQMAPLVTYQDQRIERPDIAAPLKTEMPGIEDIAAIEVDMIKETNSSAFVAGASAATLAFFISKSREGERTTTVNLKWALIVGVLTAVVSSTRN